MNEGPSDDGNHPAVITQLRQKVDTLEHKLGQLHGTDVSALRRAHRSLQQHINELEDEFQALKATLQRLHPTLLTTEFVATEAGIAGLIMWVANGVGLYVQSFARADGKSSGRGAYGATLGVGAGIALMNLARRVYYQLRRTDASHDTALLQQLQNLQERVDALIAVAQWSPDNQDVHTPLLVHEA